MKLNFIRDLLKPKHHAVNFSLYYRKHKRDIEKGFIPLRYERLLPYIRGQRILELGSAEGLQALVLAQSKKKVFGLEREPLRHQASLKLQSKWRHLGKNVSNCEFILGDIREQGRLIEAVDTFLAVRSIYYLHDNLDPLFKSLSQKVPHVVLCGNRGRTTKYESSEKERRKSPHNYYATLKGMSDLLTRHGYALTHQIDENDPIVVGRKNLA